ncbi:hypothetical protein MKZ38_003762 [Zalerion maritima]|uniref:Uncharacterized protein n=1 Tax=Zalerion maritima TaxID=339359 RepID=A0AAD5RTZ3_9PEZI|nr:hypothetical protein MKZ38_003762 [Zalerion maritima]
MEARSYLCGEAAGDVKREVKDEECAGVLASLSGKFSGSPHTLQGLKELDLGERYRSTSHKTRLPPVSELILIADAPKRFDASRRASESCSESDYVWSPKAASLCMPVGLGLPSPPPSEQYASSRTPRPAPNFRNQGAHGLASRPGSRYYSSNSSINGNPSYMAGSGSGSFHQPRTTTLSPFINHPARGPQPLVPRATHSSTYGIQKPYRYHHQQGPVPRPVSWQLHHSSPMIQKSKRKPPRKDKPHNNKQYDLEQTDYIRYLTADLGIPWDDIVTEYSKYWETRVDHPPRDRQGLQGVFYRKNKTIPAFSREGKLVLNHDGDPEIWTLKVRKAKEFAKDEHKKDRLKLSFLWPERALQYPWVVEEHKKVALENLTKQEDQRRTHKEMVARGERPPRFKPDDGYTRPEDTWDSISDSDEYDAQLQVR